MSIGATWRETNRCWLDRADRLFAEGDALGAVLALSAYARVEAVRRSVEPVEGSAVVRRGRRPRPEVWQRFMAPHPLEPWQRRTPSVAVACPIRSHPSLAGKRADRMIALVEQHVGPVPSWERALIRSACGVAG